MFHVTQQYNPNNIKSIEHAEKIVKETMARHLFNEVGIMEKVAIEYDIRKIVNSDSKEGRVEGTLDIQYIRVRDLTLEINNIPNEVKISRWKRFIQLLKGE